MTTGPNTISPAATAYAATQRDQRPREDFAEYAARIREQLDMCDSIAETADVQMRKAVPCCPLCAAQGADRAVAVLEWCETVHKLLDLALGEAYARRLGWSPPDRTGDVEGDDAQVM